MTESNTRIYHVAQPTDVKTAQDTGRYSHPSLASEGFIHCCLKEQLAGVIKRYYAKESGLQLLTIDPGKLKPELIYENTVGGEELFPHVYGQFNMDAVIAATPLPDLPGCA